MAAAAPRCPRRTAVERQAAADEMHRHRSEEPPDGIGATANLGAGGRGQEAEPQLAQQRQAPLVVGEPGVRGVGLVAGPVAAFDIEIEAARLVPVLVRPTEIDAPEVGGVAVAEREHGHAVAQTSASLRSSLPLTSGKR